MKIVFVSLLLFVQISRAEMLKEVPDYYCSDQYYDCGQETKKIVENYFAGGAPTGDTEEGLFVGSCYMVSESYNKNHEHYGYVYWRPQSNGLGFFGGFSFFYDSNPYAEMTIEEAGRLNSQDSNYVIDMHEQHWQSDTNRDPPWQYFFRANGEHLLAIGFWGLNDSIVCDLSKK